MRAQESTKLKHKNSITMDINKKFRTNYVETRKFNDQLCH